MMNMDKLVGVHVTLGRIGWRLFLLNLYWMLTTIAGGIIFGVAPATKVLFKILINDQKNPDEVENKGLFKFFWQEYKTEFLNANKMLLPLVSMIVIVFFEIRLLTVFHFTPLDESILIILKVLLIVGLLMLSNIFAFSSMAKTIRQTYQQSLILILGKPLFSLGTLALLGIVFSIYYVFPGLVMVFGMSVVAYLEVNYLSKRTNLSANFN